MTEQKEVRFHPPTVKTCLALARSIQQARFLKGDMDGAKATGNAHCVLQHCTFSRTELVLSEHYKQRLLHPNGVDGFLPKVAVVVVRHRWPSCYSHLLRLGWGKSSLPGGKNPHGFCSAMATVSGHMSLEGRSTPYRG